MLCRAGAMERALEVDSEAHVPEAVTHLYPYPVVRQTEGGLGLKA